MIEKLGKEQAKQQEHQKHVFSRLQRQCQNWFPARTTKNDAITTFLRLCLFPRCIFSPLDATYCARMVQLIHELRIPNFRWIFMIFTEYSIFFQYAVVLRSCLYGYFVHRSILDWKWSQSIWKISFWNVADHYEMAFGSRNLRKRMRRFSGIRYSCP